jgi:hypothetical protein
MLGGFYRLRGRPVEVGTTRLSAEQLRKVREYEKHNKNRETLIEQIDRKIRANS